MRIPRAEIMSRLRACLVAGKPIISTGVGAGISAACMEKGGSDLLVVYTSGYYRMEGRPSMASVLPCGDANAIIAGMARELLPLVRNVPVLAGILASDPYRDMPRFIRELGELGYSGIQNYPTAGQIDGVLREALEESGLGYDAEVAMVCEARRQDMLTQPYAFNAEEARAMAKAGCDLLIAHMGIQTKAMKQRGQGMDLAGCAQRAQLIADAAHSVREDVLVLCHGGPLNTPEDLAYVLENTEGVCGIYGASVVEYNPAGRAITAQVEAYKALKL